MLTPADIGNPTRHSGGLLSGFNHVNRVGNRWRAQQGTRGHFKGETSKGWLGPSRLTPAAAAQDYCDHVNAGAADTTLALKSAGHKRSIVTSVQVQRRKRKQPQGRQQHNAGYIYLVAEADNTDEVKIGWSSRPGFARLCELQTGNPRVLLGLAEKPGTQQDEYRLHKAYEADNVLQEWFEVSPELLSEFDLSEQAFFIATQTHGRRVTP